MIDFPTKTELAGLQRFLTAPERAEIDNHLRKIQEDKPHAQVYQFYGGAQQFLDYKGSEVILSGAFETGKTLCLLSQLHDLMYIAPSVRGLMIRKVYKDLVQSAIVTYEKKILPFDTSDPRSEVHKYGGEKPEFYDYPNGARLVCGGLDNPGKVLSSEYDFIYINQAEELDIDEYETLTARATGRAGNAPFTQVMGDCNPSYPGHWILTRQTLKLIEQKHEHNPVLFNQATGEITEQGKRTMAALDALTGIRYQRGRLGLWVAAEGVIFDNFSLTENVTEAAEYIPNLPIEWGVDDGYAHGQGIGSASYHPRVILLAQPTAQGGVNVFAEYVATQELSERTLDTVISWQYPRPEVAWIDSSAVEFKARLWERNINTHSATHPVSEGIKNVRRLVCDGNGVRLLRIHPRCGHLIRELQMYRYDPNSTAANVGEPRPLKIDNHSVDSLRYLVWNKRYGN